MLDQLTSLESSSFSTWLRESPSVWAYPTVLTLHTLGLGVLVGANWFVDLRVLGFARGIPVSVLMRAFPVMWAGFWLNAVTGMLLFAADPIAKGTTTVFMWKLAIIAVGVALLISLKRMLYGRAVATDAATFGARTLAAVSIAIWIAAIATGRWMAYVG